MPVVQPITQDMSSSDDRSTSETQKTTLACFLPFIALSVVALCLLCLQPTCSVLKVINAGREEMPAWENKYILGCHRGH